KAEAPNSTAEASVGSPAQARPAMPSIPASESAPPPSQTGGFDGQKAYDYTAALVAFGPRPPGTDAIRQTQKYIRQQLDSFGCPVEEDDFHAQTPIGTVAMKNIIAKIPGEGPGIILLLTHYDTKRLANFVGAVDGGSSSGLMIEMARLLCPRKQRQAVWIAFLDGEEAFAQWTDTDSVYGSRELAAKLAVAGDLPKIRAVILADMVGPVNLKIQRDTNSTKWLTDLVWSTAARLGYRDQFISVDTAVEDDHAPFMRRKVPSVDIIDLNDFREWHTPQDTMDKVSPRSLAIVGHVILETVNQLQKKP
ncbi:MAG: M28 family peptidase, partial [Candidatus Acidiferrales bacterium]